MFALRRKSVGEVVYQARDLGHVIACMEAFTIYVLYLILVGTMNIGGILISH